MSTLKVDAIRHNSATSDAITTAADGTCTAKLTSVGGGQLSHRNLVINGAMLVAQRGVSSTDQLYSTVDRIRAARSSVDENPTFSQVDVASGTTPYSLGFRKAFKVTNGNQTSGAGSNDVISFQYRLEAQDVANSGWDYTNTNSFITLQFWVKSSVAQNFYIRLTTQDGTAKQYSVETGVLSANTWTKVIKTISGHADLQFDNDANRGFNIDFSMFRGTDQTGSGVTLNQWANVDNNARIPNMTSTWYTTNDATFEVTGLQLEVGDTATSFEHRSYADELRRCQRYYQQLRGALTGVGANSTTIRSCYAPIVNFRASPTITGSNPVTFNNPGINSPTQSSFNCGLIFTYQPSKIGMVLGFGNFSNATNQYTYLQWDGDSDYIFMDAEL